MSNSIENSIPSNNKNNTELKDKHIKNLNDNLSFDRSYYDPYDSTKKDTLTGEQLYIRGIISNARCDYMCNEYKDDQTDNKKFRLLFNSDEECNKYISVYPRSGIIRLVRYG